MKIIIPEAIRQQALDTYKSVIQNTSHELPVTVLHIDGNYCFIIQGNDSAKLNNLWVFDIGLEITADDYFYHNPPTFNEMENAIMMVEDEVMPLHKLLAPHSGLYTTDAGIREIAQLTVFTENKQGITLTLSNMESVFNRLAAIITGLPASQDCLPTTKSFAVTLLILREVMHHLGFMDINIFPL